MENIFIIKNNILIECTDKTIKNAVIPEGTTEIGSNAFSDCVSLRQVTFPSTLREIGACAFCDCKALESAEFPQGLKFIGNSAFYGCECLERVTIPDSVKGVDELAFAYCRSLKELRLPDNTDILDGNAFADCESLKYIIKPEGKCLIDYWMHKTVFPCCNIPIQDNESPYDYPKVTYIDDETDRDIHTEHLMIKGFVRGGYPYTEEMTEIYKKYIKENREELYLEAAEDEYLFDYMIDNKIVPFEDIEKLLQITENISKKAKLLSYADTNFTKEEKDLSGTNIQ